jgi:hypothetical protein
MYASELQKSQETFDSIQSSYTANEEDIQNIRNFCKNQLELKQANSNKNSSSKPFIQECKKCKQFLLNELENNKMDIYKINESLFLHMCIRKRTNSITFELLREIFSQMDDTFFEDELQEEQLHEKQDGQQNDQQDSQQENQLSNRQNDQDSQQRKLNEENVYIQAILKKLQMMTKALTKTIKISEKIPRDLKNSKIFEAPSKVKQISLQFAENTEKLKKVRAEMRDDLKIKKETIKILKHSVEEYLMKANVNNQRVAFENNAYQLIRKVSVGKPRLKLDMIESCLHSTCQEFLQTMKKRPKSLLQHFIKNKKKILELLEEKLIEIPQEPKTSILLRKMKEESTENWTMEEDEDDEDETDSKNDFEENSEV